MTLRSFCRTAFFISMIACAQAWAGESVGHTGPRVDGTGGVALAAGTLLMLAVVGLTIVLQRSRSELRRTQAQLRKSQLGEQSKSMFLANVCHEIRTPMTAILGFAEMLEDPQLTHSQRVEHLATVQRNGKHLLAVLNNVLDLSRIEANRLQVEKITVPLAALVIEAVELLRPTAVAKHIRLNCRIDQSAPDTITSDPTRLRQILLNLIGNAVKFTDAGQVDVRVYRDSYSTADGSSVCIDVSDTGIGMSPAQIQNLFKPFGQADHSTARRFGGSGLGLVISRRLAQLLGGDITVAGRPEKGTTFTLTVAGAAPAVTKEPKVTTRPHLCQSGGPANRGAAIELHGRILLAEDGPDNQRLIAYLLRKAGAQVDIVADGAIAVRQITAAVENEAPYDLVVMDVMMPEMDGLAATRALRELGIDVPIVALTAHAMSGDRERCLAAGCNDYAPKPIDRIMLLQTCADLLRTTHKASAAVPR